MVRNHEYDEIRHLILEVNFTVCMVKTGYHRVRREISCWKITVNQKSVKLATKRTSVEFHFWCANGKNSSFLTRFYQWINSSSCLIKWFLFANEWSAIELLFFCLWHERSGRQDLVNRILVLSKFNVYFIIIFLCRLSCRLKTSLFPIFNSLLFSRVCVKLKFEL